VERTAEAIGADLAQREQEDIKQALPLHLPAVTRSPSEIDFDSYLGRAADCSAAGVVLIDRMSKGCKMRLWAKGSGVVI
jgi:hypothetical protein